MMLVLSAAMLYVNFVYSNIIVRLGHVGVVVRLV
jgi:hypothetical protein